jgi:hypothetical protein
MEGGREGGRKGGREGGREGGRKEVRENGKEDETEEGEVTGGAEFTKQGSKEVRQFCIGDIIGGIGGGGAYFHSMELDRGMQMERGGGGGHPIFPCETAVESLLLKGGTTMLLPPRRTAA